MRIMRDFVLALVGVGAATMTLGCAAGAYNSTTPAEHAMWRAAEAGNPEAQRRVAVDLTPHSKPGGAAPDAGHAAFWFKEACKQRYANAAVEFLEFAEKERLRSGDSRYVGDALTCLHAAIDQGHRDAIKTGAIRAATRERDFPRAYYLYALMEEGEPVFADRRWEIVDDLIPGQPERIDRRAADWRASNALKDDDDFLIERNSK
jgi:TPR repeat protein